MSVLCLSPVTHSRMSEDSAMGIPILRVLGSLLFMVFKWRSSVFGKFPELNFLILSFLSFSSKINLFILCLWVLYLHEQMYTICMPDVPSNSGKNLWFPGTGDKDCCVPLYGFWELNLVPLQGQVFLTSELYLQPLELILLICFEDIHALILMSLSILSFYTLDKLYLL